MNERQPETSAPPTPSSLGRRGSEGPARELPIPLSWGQAVGFLCLHSQGSLFSFTLRRLAFCPLVLRLDGEEGRSSGQGSSPREEGAECPDPQMSELPWVSCVALGNDSSALCAPASSGGREDAGKLMLSRARVRPGALRSPVQPRACAGLRPVVAAGRQMSPHPEGGLCRHVLSL